MQNGKDLKERTKRFALLVIEMYSTLPKTTVAQVLGNAECRMQKENNSYFLIL